MDVSTLFAAPNTAASTAALSFGALAGNGGNVTAPGDGLEGLDSFNQLLGNFLSLTGGEMPATSLGEAGLALAGDGTATALAVPQGVAAAPGSALLNGMGMLNGLSGNAVAGKPTEGRWAQSGLNLLAGGGLTGQEINPEVLDFLNDLSSVIAANGSLTTLEPGVTPATDRGEVLGADTDLETEATETLIVLQGDTGTIPVMPAVPTPAPVSVIPRPLSGSVTTAPATAGLMTMTTAGTGLQALPTVPAPEDSAVPAQPPVIPRLSIAAAPTVAPVPTKAVQMTGTQEPIPTAPVIDTAVSSAPTTALADDTAKAPVMVMQAAAPVREAVVTEALPPSATIVPAASATSERVAAIALPAELVATASTEAAPVTLPTAAEISSLPRVKVAETAPSAPQTTASMTAPAVAPKDTSQAAPTVTSVQTVPVDAVTTVEPRASTNVVAALPGQDIVIPAATTKSEPTVSAAMADEAPPKPIVASTIIAKAPAEPVKAPRTQPAEVAATIPVTPATETMQITEPDESAGSDPQAPEAATPDRPALTATKSAVTPTHAQAKATAVPSPVPVTDDTPAPVAEEPEEVTNQRMLAPKHMGNEVRAEAQTDMAGPAQTAGQNTTNARPDAAAPTVNGEREDNLLSRAVTAAGKAPDGGSSTEGGAGSGTNMAAPTDLPDSMTGTLSGSDTAKTQGSDFTQSLRQTAAPHRPTPYMPVTHQMAMQVQRAVQDGNERLSIRLNPQELGRIDVQLEIGTEGKLRAKVMVENPQTLEMLQKDAKTLEKALQDAGLQTDQNSLSFSLQDSGDQARQRQDQRDEAGHGTALALPEDEQEDPAILAQTQILELGRVDVRV